MAEEDWFKCPPDDWNRQMNAQVVRKIPLKLRGAAGVTGGYLVKLQQDKPMLAN
jgi:hypothetical protein